MSEQKETAGGVEVHALAGLAVETNTLHVIYIDKEHHAAYATLIDRDKQAIRDIVREEVTQVLTLMRDKPEVMNPVSKDEGACP